MSQMVTLPVSGLIVDPNPLVTGRRSGALRQADEVIFERPGQALSRPAFRTSTLKTGVTYRPHSMYVWGDDVIVNSKTSGNVFRLENLTDVLSADEKPPSFSTVPMNFVEGRRSLYFTTRYGVRKLTSSSATPGYTGTWINTNVIFGFGGGGGILGSAVTTWRAAYRYCVVSKDVNGYDRRSAPSPRLDMQTSVAGLGYGISSGAFFIHDGIAAGDVIEFYRTKIVTPNTTVPSEEYFFAFSVVVTAADVTGGMISTTIRDNTPDESLGPSLYTNPSQGGLEASNEVPPLANCLALYENCYWFGNTTHRQRIGNSIVDVGGYTGGAYTNTTGLQFRTTTGDITNGSNQLTNVAAVTGLVAGMVVSRLDLGFAEGPGETGTYFDPDTTIISITGAGPYTVNLSANAKATAAGVTLSFHDVITLTRDSVSTSFYTWNNNGLWGIGGWDFAYRLFSVSADASQVNRAGTTRAAFMYVLNGYEWEYETTTSLVVRGVFLDATESAGVGGDRGQFFIESRNFGGSTFTMTSSRPDAFATPLTSSGQVSDPTYRPHRIYYSKPEEPEAVPIGNFLEVGSESGHIIAMVPTGTGLYVFKEDGVYRLTGQAPNFWRVELVSPNLRLVRGAAACAIDNAVVALTNQGVVTISGLDVSSLSDGRVNSVFETYAAKWYESESRYPAFVVHWPALNLILVGVPDDTGGSSDIITAVYVYSINANQWSRWTISGYCCAYSRNKNEMYYAYRTQNAIVDHWDVRVSSRVVSGHDVVYTVDGTGAGASVVNSGPTFGIELNVPNYETNIPGWSPKVGDWVRWDEAYYRVDSVRVNITTLLLSFTVDPPVGAVNTTIFCYEGIRTKLQWQAHHVTPAVSALYREIQPQLTFLTASSRTGFGVVAGGSNDYAALATAEHTAASTPSTPSFPIRVGVGREIARCTHFYPYVEIGEPGGRWTCSGVVLEFDATSERMKR